MSGMRPSGVYSASTLDGLDIYFEPTGRLQLIHSGDTVVEIVRVWVGPFVDNATGRPIDTFLRLSFRQVIFSSFITGGVTSDGEALNVVKLQGEGDSTTSVTKMALNGSQSSSSLFTQINMTNTRNQWMWQPLPDRRPRTAHTRVDFNPTYVTRGFYVEVINISSDGAEEFDYSYPMGMVWNEYK